MNLSYKTETKQKIFVSVNNSLIPLYTSEHFTPTELKHISLRLSKVYKALTKYPLTYYEQEYKNLRQDYQLYAHFLAYFQRIRLPLVNLVHTRISYKNYPIDSTPNFQLLNQLFEQYYPCFDPLHINNTKRKKRFKTNLFNLVFKLWMSGYGLSKGYGLEPLTDKILMDFNNISLQDQGQKSLQFLSFSLSHIPTSLFNKMINFTSNTSIIQRSQNNWNNISHTELTKAIQHYLFDFLLNRATEKGYIFEYNAIDGTLRRETQKPLTFSSWSGHSRSLHSVCVILCDLGITTFKELLNYGISEVFEEFTENENISKGIFSRYYYRFKDWLSFYIKSNQLHINIENIMPYLSLKREKRHGKVFNISAAVTLIETLLDDQSTHHNENILSEFRYRRTCLLQLETGHRIHEICLLLKDCIKKTAYGDHNLLFHKSKTGKKSSVTLSLDAIEWIKELQAVSPPIQISCPSEFYSWGDDKKAYRLLPNSSNDAPQSPFMVNYYLKNLQKKIWGDNHPNGTSFTSHDLRRMVATFMKIRGYSNEDIKTKLGHENIESQLPYQLTQPIQHIKEFENIFEEGLYSNLEDYLGEKADQELSNEAIQEDVFSQVSKFIDSSIEDRILTENMLKRLVHTFKTIELPKDSYIPENDASAGFIMRTHNCTAHTKVTCKHTELKCFGCAHYKPDSDKLMEHKAEIFRWILVLDYNNKIFKAQKKKADKERVSLRVADIEENLSSAFRILFHKFNLDQKEIQQITCELYNKADIYRQTFKKKLHLPSYQQALQFCESGVIDG